MASDLSPPSYIQALQDRTLYTVVVDYENHPPSVYRYRDPVGAEHMREDLGRKLKEKGVVVYVLPPLNETIA